MADTDSNNKSLLVHLKSWCFGSTTATIFSAMIAGVLIGALLKNTVFLGAYIHDIVAHLFDVGGALFVRLMKMIVIPIVSISVICGIAQLENVAAFGKMGFRTLVLYLTTTAVAIALALFFAQLFSIGHGLSLGDIASLEIQNAPGLKHTIIHMVPDNPFAAMVQAKMLQIIIFSSLIGASVLVSGSQGRLCSDFFVSLNAVLMSLVSIVMKFVPVGVFCLMGKLVMKTGFAAILGLSHYFMTVVFVLGLQLAVVYGAFILLIGLNPLIFIKKMVPAMLFAFSISSSSASIPIVMRNARDRLGVSDSVVSFVIPLGATLNMDGTAIMQGVATVFIANAFQIELNFVAYLTIIGMATLASVGTAGVPGVGLITLSMVLQQVGVPVEGIALILGVDRLLDMMRTAINIAGDSMVACVVDQSDGGLQKAVFSSP